MHTKALLSEWMERIARTLGIQGVPMNDTGIVALDCGDDLLIHIGAFDANDFVHFFATLVVAPDDPQTMRQILWTAARINLDLLPLVSGKIGLSSDEREFVLSAHEPMATLDFDRFARQLADLITVCKAARGQLRQCAFI